MWYATFLADDSVFRPLCPAPRPRPPSSASAYMNSSAAGTARRRARPAYAHPTEKFRFPTYDLDAVAAAAARGHAHTSMGMRRGDRYGGYRRPCPPGSARGRPATAPGGGGRGAGGAAGNSSRRPSSAAADAASLDVPALRKRRAGLTTDAWADMENELGILPWSNGKRDGKSLFDGEGKGGPLRPKMNTTEEMGMMNSVAGVNEEGMLVRRMEKQTPELMKKLALEFAQYSEKGQLGKEDYVLTQDVENVLKNTMQSADAPDMRDVFALCGIDHDDEDDMRPSRRVVGGKFAAALRKTGLVASRLEKVVEAASEHITMEGAMDMFMRMAGTGRMQGGAAVIEAAKFLLGLDADGSLLRVMEAKFAVSASIGKGGACFVARTEIGDMFQSVIVRLTNLDAAAAYNFVQLYCPVYVPETEEGEGGRSGGVGVGVGAGSGRAPSTAVTKEKMAVALALSKDMQLLATKKKVSPQFNVLRKSAMSTVVKSKVKDLKRMFAVTKGRDGTISASQARVLLENSGLRTDDYELEEILEMMTTAGTKTKKGKKQTKQAKKAPKKKKKKKRVDYIRFLATIPYLLELHYKISRKALKGMG